jgi:cardiolipin synthase
VRLLVDAQQFYPALYERIDAARHHVHVEFFIVRNDSRGEELRDHLVAAAKRGVEVRLLIDQIGSLGTEQNPCSPARRSRGKFAWFRTAHPLRNRWTFILRNHRKLQIIDGRHAFVGGMNIGREYASEDPHREMARCQVEISGCAARNCKRYFADDWFFATEEKIPRSDATYPTPACTSALSGSGDARRSRTRGAVDPDVDCLDAAMRAAAALG